jgi:hypothetical protein
VSVSHSSPWALAAAPIPKANKNTNAKDAVTITFMISLLYLINPPRELLKSVPAPQFQLDADVVLPEFCGPIGNMSMRMTQKVIERGVTLLTNS